jgi:hypothetical protein
MAEHILTAIKEALASIAAALWERVGDLDQLLAQLGGTDSRYVIYVVAAVVGLMLFARVLKLSFTILSKVVLPAALLAWAVGNYFNFPFLTIFPALVGAGSVWMLYKA